MDTLHGYICDICGKEVRYEPGRGIAYTLYLRMKGADRLPNYPEVCSDCAKKVRDFVNTLVTDNYKKM